MNANTINDDIRDGTAVAMFVAGHGQREIYEATGLTDSTVRRLAMAAGYVRKRALPKGVTAASAERIIALYHEGELNGKEIKALFRLKKNDTLAHVLIACGYKPIRDRQKTGRLEPVRLRIAKSPPKVNQKRAQAHRRGRQDGVKGMEA